MQSEIICCACTVRKKGNRVAPSRPGCCTRGRVRSYGKGVAALLVKFRHMQPSYLQDMHVHYK
jgi:hypothetical protein